MFPIQAAPIDRANRAVVARNGGAAGIAPQAGLPFDPCLICSVLPPPANAICQAICGLIK